MIFERPQFRLERVLEDGSREEPAIVPVTSLPWDTRMDRRGAVATSIGLAGIAAMLGGCVPRSSARPSTPERAACPGPQGLRAHKSRIVALAVTPDGNTLISQCGDGKVKVWALPAGQLLHTLDTTVSHLPGLVLAPDGRTLATLRLPGGEIWSIPEGRRLASLKCAGGKGEFAFTPDGKYFATSACGGDLTLHGAADGEVVASIEAQLGERALDKVVFTPDGRLLVSQALGGPVRIWSVPDGRAMGTVGDKDVHTIYAAGDGATLVTIGSDTITLWDLATLKARAAVHDDGGWSAMSKDGKLIASWTREEALRLRSTVDGRIVMNVAGRSPTIAPGGDYMTAYAPGNGELSLVLWSIVGGRGLTRLDASGPVAFTPDGKKLITFKRGALKVWSVPGGDLLSSAPADADTFAPTIETVVVAQGGKMAISGTSHGVIALTVLGAGCSTYAFDPQATSVDRQANSYNVYDQTLARWVTYTMPCGSPIPPGATCTCNCVPGALEHPPPPPSTGAGGGYCSCNKVCTCVPVYYPSSRRWKANVTPIVGALETVTRLRGVRFDWTKDAPHRPSGADLGVIAEDVAEVLPEIVARDEDGAPRAVDYARITAVLIEAVKTQQQQIDDLRSTVRALAAKARPARPKRRRGRH